MANAVEMGAITIGLGADFYSAANLHSLNMFQRGTLLHPASLVPLA